MREEFAMPQSRVLTQQIDVPLEAAYGYAKAPAHFAEWAAGLATALRQTEAGWVAETPEGTAKVRFSPPNAFGILDHRVQFDGRPDIYIPLRMIENGDGTEVQLTLLRQPGMDDAMFEADAGMVAKDLQALKTLLEGRFPR